MNKWEGQYENPFTLNEFVGRLAKLDDYEQDKVFYLMDIIGCDREKALEHYEDVTYYQDMTMDDVAYELVEDGVFGDLSDAIKSYLDYEKLARDLQIDGYYETDKGVFWYQ